MHFFLNFDVFWDDTIMYFDLCYQIKKTVFLILFIMFYSYQKKYVLHSAKADINVEKVFFSKAGDIK